MAERTAKERTGRRAWRQWSNRCEYKRRCQARKHQVEYSPLMSWNEKRKANNEGIRPPEKLAKSLTAADLVGMTMGARKRYLAAEIQREADRIVAAGGTVKELAESVWRRDEFWQIYKKIRPCPGCPKCGVFRFQRVGGFGDNTACIEHRVAAGTSRMIRRAGAKWRYGQGRRSKSAPFHPLALCQQYVAEGDWIQGPDLCDGSGVLPAKSQRSQANG